MPSVQHDPRNPDPLTGLKNLLHADLKGVDERIHRHLESSVPLVPTLAQHLIYAGGKRLRPLLTLASYRLFKEDGEEALDLAAAIEFIHTATLLHDDVIDESRLRRGLPTANDLWGNQASVLVGDFLFARSFQLMVVPNNPSVLKLLANAAACISEGEILQLSLLHKQDVKKEELLRVIEAKTATLFAAACEVGAMLANQIGHAPALRAYGHNLGMAFQIIDDVLDYSVPTGQLGKETGDDFREGKLTLPVALAYPNCSPDEQQFFQRTLIDQNQTPDDLRMALSILQKRQGLSQAYELATTYGRQAREALQGLPGHPITSLLADLIDHNLERQV